MIRSYPFVGRIRRERPVPASHNFEENGGIVKDELFAVFVCIWMAKECKLISAIHFITLYNYSLWPPIYSTRLHS